MALSFDQFVSHLTSSELISADEITSFVAALPEDRRPQDGEALARELVKQKRLTKFQAEQVYSGKGKSLVLGNYTILDKLGQGGMGMVLKAEHKRLKRLVAIKVMSPAALKTPDALKRFHREVEAAAKLRHPNVVATDDADEAKGTHFLVMEYVEGSDLSARVKKQGPLPVDQAVGCILQAARGLEFAHEQGVVHRDIKPANLLLDAKGTVKVLDMGLARIEGEVGSQAELTSTGAVMGTVDYMAPEQALSTKHADARSDIYSLGISLWYLLTGKCAYDGDTLMAKLLAHREAPIPSLRQIRADVPESVDAVFQKMVAKNAQDRYQTMTDVIVDLEEILGGTGSASNLRIPISLGDSLSGGLATSGMPASASKMTRPFPSVRTSPPTKTTATYTPPADSATEATRLSGDMAQATDPQSMSSARSPLDNQKETGDQKGRKSAAASVWWQDRRVQIGGGIGALLFVLAVVFLSPGKKFVPNKPSNVAANDSAKSSDKTGLPAASATNIATESATEAPPPAVAPFDAVQARAHQEAWAKHLGVPVEYTNSIGMKFVLIPPGEFMMGSTPEEIEAALKEVSPDDEHWLDCIKSEAPQHKVILTQPFYLGVNEVTQAEYEKVMGTNPSHFAPMSEGKEAVAGLETADHPVEMVSWNDAAEFCAKLSQLEKLKPFYFQSGETITPLNGTGYRLPSEAEWEFACRAGTATKYWIGDNDEDLMRAGWFNWNAGGRTHAAGELKANPFGLVDIHGNVIEWVQDRWGATFYSQFQEKPAINPVSPTSAGFRRVLRGGLWYLSAACCRSSFREAIDPLNRHYNIGFRVSLMVDAVKATLAESTAPRASIAAAWNGWPANAPPPAVAPFDAAQARAHQEAWAKHLGVPVEYTNTIGMKFMLIPPGEFMMGSTAAEIAEALKEVGENKLLQECIRSEAPQHKVILTQPIYLGANEVTQAEYEKVMGSNPSHFAPMGMGKEAVAGLETAEHPVEKVSWNDAAEFCAKLSKQEKLKPFYYRAGETITPLDGTGYRLPSEAEWEFACRAGTATKYWIGDKDEDLVQAGWFGGNSRGRTHAAGELKANPFGLYDNHGNVWEWVQDGWNATYYGQFQEKSAIDPNSPFSAGPLRVIRGGSWGYSASICRSSHRHAPGPSDRRDVTIGFRASLTVDTVRQALMVRQTADAAPPAAVAPFDEAVAKKHQEAWAKHLGTQVETVNSVGQTMVLIPPGEFLMGSSDEQVEAALKVAEEFKADISVIGRIEKAERPQHKVVITMPFLMSATEVTIGQFKKFSATGYITEAEKARAAARATDPSQTPAKPIQTYNDPGFAITDDLPAGFMSWNDAMAYCKWLSEQEGATYRLPTEAEWEYACRAGTTTQYSFGNDLTLLDQYGWHNKNSRSAPHPVGTKLPNGFGLFDMHGNVPEWCSDYYDEKWYEKAPPINPNGPAVGHNRVIRGSYWLAYAFNSRSAVRNSSPSSRYPDTGFRVVRELDAPATTASITSTSPRDTITPADGWVDVGKLVDPAADSKVDGYYRDPAQWTDGELVLGHRTALSFPWTLHGNYGSSGNFVAKNSLV